MAPDRAYRGPGTRGASKFYDERRQGPGWKPAGVVGVRLDVPLGLSPWLPYKVAGVA